MDRKAKFFIIIAGIFLASALFSWGAIHVISPSPSSEQKKSLYTSSLSIEELADAKVLFGKCQNCHSLSKHENKVGPSLYGIENRRAGAMPNFPYSQAMRKSNIIWTKENLKKFLEKPRDLVPGNRMAFLGMKDHNSDQDIDLLIKYIFCSPNS